jgi:hypothetical protein
MKPPSARSFARRDTHHACDVFVVNAGMSHPFN